MCWAPRLDQDWGWSPISGLATGKLPGAVSDAPHSCFLKLSHSLSIKLGDSAKDLGLDVVEANYSSLRGASSSYLGHCGDTCLLNGIPKLGISVGWEEKGGGTTPVRGGQQDIGTCWNYLWGFCRLPSSLPLRLLVEMLICPSWGRGEVTDEPESQ